jgi:hypothetical protein
MGDDAAWLRWSRLCGVQASVEDHAGVKDQHEAKGRNGSVAALFLLVDAFTDRSGGVGHRLHARSPLATMRRNHGRESLGDSDQR